jgi:hypothetical protein
MCAPTGQLHGAAPMMGLNPAIHKDKPSLHHFAKPHSPLAIASYFSNNHLYPSNQLSLSLRRGMSPSISHVNHPTQTVELALHEKLPSLDHNPRGIIKKQGTYT